MDGHHSPLSGPLGELLPELNEHLGSLAVLLHQYLKHGWFTFETPALQQKNYQNVLADMNHLGTFIVRLGGVPPAGMLEQTNVSYLEPEAEGRHTLFNMLESNLYLETVHGSRLRLTLETAQELCEINCVETVQTLISSSEKRATTITTLQGRRKE